MKIALVTPYDYAYQGGVTEHVAHLTQGLRRIGHQVHIIAPFSSNHTPEIESPLVHPIGRVIPIPTNGSVARVTLPLRGYVQVKRLLAHEQFDVIHLQEPMMPALPLTVLRHSHTVNIGTFHAFRRSNIAYFYAKPVIRPFFRKLHGLIAVSRPARDFVAEYFPGDYRIIPNGIEYDRFATPVEPLAQYRDGALNVLFVGRLEKRKGLGYLLRAWGAVRSEFDNVRLIVVGEGRPLENYKAFAANQGWKEVEFVGYAPPQLLAAYYQSADVFCAPSTGAESFGIILLEAMAAGKPIVATRIDGYSEVITHGHEGLLVEPKDSQALAVGLTHLLADAGLRRKMGRQGQRKAQSFDWPRVAERVGDFYQEVRDRPVTPLSRTRLSFRGWRRAASGVVHFLGR